jgi:hypothetical protein
MTIGYFGRAFNFKHKSLTTKTHIVNNDRVLCGYKPHKTLSFQWCIIGVGINKLDIVECKECRVRAEKLLQKEKVK